MQTPKRYVTLDAMRGVAALVVAYYHFGLMTAAYAPRYGYLAVDLFFLLSGFVLEKAYADRFEEGLDGLEFMCIRAIRLGPIYYTGFLLGLIGIVLFPNSLEIDWAHSKISNAINLFLLPSIFNTNKWGSPFSINPPFWSLFFEFWVVNLVLAAFYKHLKRKTLISIILICAAGLIISEKIFCTLDLGSRVSTFISGFPRVGFSFFLGYAISKVHRYKPPKTQIPSAFCLATLIILLFLPLTGSASHYVEIIIVLLGFPALIYYGAEARDNRPKIGEILGNISYAVYAVHYPILAVASRVLIRSPSAKDSWVQITIVGLIGLLGFALDRWPDRLARRVLSRSTAKPALEKYHQPCA